MALSTLKMKRLIEEKILKQKKTKIQGGQKLVDETKTSPPNGEQMKRRESAKFASSIAPSIFTKTKVMSTVQFFEIVSAKFKGKTSQNTSSFPFIKMSKNLKNSIKYEDGNMENDTNAHDDLMETLETDIISCNRDSFADVQLFVGDDHIRKSKRPKSCYVIGPSLSNFQPMGRSRVYQTMENISKYLVTVVVECIKLWKTFPNIL